MILRGVQVVGILGDRMEYLLDTVYSDDEAEGPQVTKNSIVGVPGLSGSHSLKTPSTCRSHERLLRIGATSNGKPDATSSLQPARFTLARPTRTCSPTPAGRSKLTTSITSCCERERFCGHNGRYVPLGETVSLLGIWVVIRTESATQVVFGRVCAADARRARRNQPPAADGFVALEVSLRDGTITGTLAKPTDIRLFSERGRTFLGG